MATAKKLPSGNWRCRVTYTDDFGARHTESFTAPTRKAAEYAAAKWEIERKDRKQEREMMGMTVEEAIDQYIESGECRGLKPTTIATYLKYKRCGLKPLLSMRLKALSKSVIQKELNARAAGHAPKTVKAEFSFLVTVLSVYHEELNLSKLVYPDGGSEEMQIPEDAGVQRLIEAAKKQPDFYLAVLFAAVLGLRRSEICALEWSDVDWQNNRITISKAMTKDKYNDFVISRPKTKAGHRVVFIPDAIMADLRAARQLGGRIINLTPDAVTRRYERLREHVGLSCRFHDLRHYHASVMLALGVPAKYIMADMGHATMDMVNKVYGHRMGEKQKVIDASMAKHAQSLMLGEQYDYTVPRKVTRARKSLAK